jgi:hypothetical protein
MVPLGSLWIAGSMLSTAYFQECECQMPATRQATTRVYDSTSSISISPPPPSTSTLLFVVW